MANGNVENSITVTLVGNGIGAGAGVIANQIAAATAANPTVAAGYAFAKMTIISVGAETFTVVIAVQSGDPDRIGSASTAAIGSIAAAVVAGAIVGAASAGIVVSAVTVGAAGWAGTQIGKAIWEEFKDGIDHSNPNPPTSPPFPYADTNENCINPATNTDWSNGQNYVPPPPRRDPLVLDLNGNGLETVGINPLNPILFDHDGDGIKQSTGWIAPSDGLLVMDKNGNGMIDNGRELFGDATLKSNGQLASDGFDALADMDSNHDGKVSALDTNFTNPFYSQFTDTIPLSAAVQTLPDMQGSGMVRDLREVANDAVFEVRRVG